LLFSPSRIMTYSLLNWPKVYIPHCGEPFFLMSLSIIPFSKIFLTVLFDTLTNNVPFLFLFLIKHLFKCVSLLCIYNIILLLYFYLFICGILILLCMYFHMSNIWFFCPAHRPSKTFSEIVKSPYWLDILFN
jgi:hypothetical protein